MTQLYCRCLAVLALSVTTLLGCGGNDGVDSEEPSSPDLGPLSAETITPRSDPDPGLIEAGELSNPEGAFSEGLADDDDILAAQVSPNQPEPISLPPDEFARLIEQAERDDYRDQIVDLKKAQELKQQQAYNFYYPPGTTVPETIITYNTLHICFMTGWRGRIRNDSGSPDFRVGVPSYHTQNEITIEKDSAAGTYVKCIPRSYFTSPGGFSPWQYFYSYVYHWPSNNCNDVSTNYVTQNGEWALTISGLGYDFNHEYDRIWVTQTDSVTGSNTFSTDPRSPCNQVGYYTAVRLHNDGSPARFKGPNGTGQASFAGEWYYWAKDGGNVSVALGVSPSHQCYFTYVGGVFSNNNDQVLLTQTSPAGYWSLLMNSVSGGHVKAKVRCIPYSQ